MHKNFNVSSYQAYQDDVEKKMFADLERRGYSIKKIKPTDQIGKNQYRICMRVIMELDEDGNLTYFKDRYGSLHPNVDYHFMRQTASGTWCEKRGWSGAYIDRGKIDPSTSRWPFGNREYDSETRYYAITKNN